MILLKPFTIVDLSQLNQWIKDEKELFRFAGDYFIFPIDKKQIKKYLQDKNRFAFQVLYQGNPVGHAEIYKESPQQARLCRILISDVVRGKGLGKKTVKTLLHKCFNEPGMETMHLNVFAWNTGAITCYKKCGFQITPCQTTKIYYQNETWLTLNMRITKAQWVSDN